MKRINVPSVFGLSLVLLLAACGSDSKQTPKDSGPANDRLPINDAPKADGYQYGQFGEPCDGNKLCDMMQKLFCADVPGHGSICTTSCMQPNDPVCPAQSYCQLLCRGQYPGYCVPGTEPPPSCQTPDGGATADAGMPDGDAGAVDPRFTVTKIGDPTWEVVEVQTFSANTGSAADNYAAGLNATKAVLDQHTFYSYGCYGFGPDPAQCHNPHGELAAGISGAGLTPRSTFSTTDLEPPLAIHFAFTLLPGPDAPWAESPCGCGPALPDEMITFDGDLYRDGQIVDAAFDDAFCRLRDLAPQYCQHSYDHLHILFFENTEFITAEAGQYEMRMRFYDGQHRGWEVRKSFVVE